MQPDELKALRKSAKMTQEQLADAIGMARPTMGLMERGMAPIERRTAIAVRSVITQKRMTDGDLMHFDEDETGALTRNTTPEAIEREKNKLINLLREGPLQ